MGVPTAGDFNKWTGTRKFDQTDWDQNVDKTVEILANGNYDLNVNQITASNYVGLPTDTEVFNMNVENGYLYVSGAGNFETEQSATPGQSVLVDTTGGSTIKGNDGSTHVSTAVSKTTVALPASDASNPRWDLVEFDASAGTFNVNQGTASANPTYPTLAANKDAIAFVYRKASTAGNTVYNRDILDARVSIKNKTVDGHFKTNFSIDQKEDTENSSFDNQQMLQQVPFGTKFDYVQEDKTNLQYVDTILVPADSVNGEVVYSGTWANDDSSSYKFARAKYSSTANSTAVFDFTGVSVNLIYTQNNISSSFWTAELSSDGGSTYYSKKTFNNSVASDQEYSNVMELYQGLEYGDYKVKITVLAGSDNCYLEGFSYATYLVQTPMTKRALLSESPTDIDDVPPLTTLIGGTWNFDNYVGNVNWNSVLFETSVSSSTLEYKFYGSSIYMNVFLGINYSSVFSVAIDGATTYVKNSSISLPFLAVDNNVWIRLDNGQLPEGVHTVKITITTASSSPARVFTVSGWAHHSSKFPTTCARSLICGKESYAVGTDDTAYTESGTFTKGDATNGFLGRHIFTSTNGDYLSITSPSNVKAIYLITDLNIDQGEIKLSLGGASSNLRYVNIDTQNFQQGAYVQLIYDSYIDGISLDGLELRITKNSGTYMRINGVIFEIGDAVENDSLYCMPKWTRYNTSTSLKTVVSTSHRLDVYGSKSDASPGRQPMVHSGFVYHSSGSYCYYKHGLNTVDVDYNLFIGGTTPKIDKIRDISRTVYSGIGDRGQIYLDNYATNEWAKFVVTPNRVI